MNIQELANSINGQIKGADEFFTDFTGRFLFLNNADNGDIVIRHWINDKGVEMAASKNISCLITQNPKDGALEKAEEINFPLIVVDKIELASAYALKHAISNFSPDSKNVIITGTNGKSTTSHLIYHIIDNAGFRVLTNTDSESEFNTLIDPMVANMVASEVIEKGPLDYLVIEVSEVQGWLGNLMKNHAYLMADAVSANVGVITNIAMDHIGLVNSIDEVFNEIQAVPNAIKDSLILNHDDELVMRIDSSKNNFYCSMNKLDDSKNNIYYDDGVVYDGEVILRPEELPFNSYHFIQNILSAVGACIALGIDIEDIREGVKSYKSLNRRFSRISEDPLIFDDFAHNPDGIKATIKESLKLVPEGKTLHVACAIRGSRGVDINKLNAEALVESFNDNIELYLSSSIDVVDNLNVVIDEEREIFFEVLNRNNIGFKHFDNLVDTLETVCREASEGDVILLIGAQGMDPAEGFLKDII
ncbi:MAG: Mur ligase family protein [Methanobrevibacter sp.]|uniref:Mur ligase family protein n=1 Tax=Methanobrevibacter sp. TaxID=66852 RepID=UPI0026DF0BDE|nr:Mur ligase family protein [Methanobrevibacter sp.]MDO5848367.1 Mur ligase family protein [Methanobrevibacter sp.]